MSAIYEDAKNRIPSQKQKILKALRDAGESGITNADLSNISLRWGARMSELYAEGYIVDIESLGKGIYKYALQHEPTNIVIKPQKAVDVLLQEVVKIGDSVTSKQLQELLDKHNFNVTRKAGSHKNF